MILIEAFQIGRERAIHELIKKVYDEFVASDYTEAGNRFFYDWIQPSLIASRQEEQNNILLAFDDSVLAGMIEIRENKFVSLLFVDKNYQGQGIARQLFQEAKKICLLRNATLDKIFVHASPFSIPIYKKLGFTETDVMKEEHGITYLPMEYKIIEV